MGANLNGVDLEHADLTGANLTAAELSDTRNLSQRQLDLACGDDAKLPQGLTLKPCPPGSYK